MLEMNTIPMVGYCFGKPVIDGDAPWRREIDTTKDRDKDVVIFVSRRRKSPVFPQN